VVEVPTRNAAGKSYAVSGMAQPAGDNQLTITELPVRTWTQTYKEFLETLMKPPAAPARGAAVAGAAAAAAGGLCVGGRCAGAGMWRACLTHLWPPSFYGSFHPLIVPLLSTTCAPFSTVIRHPPLSSLASSPSA
jgi:hypothetical protein